MLAKFPNKIRILNQYQTYSIYAHFSRYEVMKQCWHIEPNKRLNFQELVDKMQAFLEDKGEYLCFPVDKDYYNLSPKTCTGQCIDPYSRTPTPRRRKQDEYLEPTDLGDNSTFVQDCGINSFRKEGDC